MPNYETYRDILNEHAIRRNDFGSSMAIMLLVAAALFIASVI